MQGSSRRVGPTYDTLRVVVQPWPGRTNYTVTRIHFEGRNRTDTRVSSGTLPVTPKELVTTTATGLLQLVLNQMRLQAQPPAPPQGDMGEQLTLNLDSTA